MQIFTLKTIVLTAVCVLGTATAQNIYRCADSYSHTPCPGGVLVDVADKRSSAQKTQADAATNRDAQSAEAMEKARLQQEQRDLAANTPLAKPPGTDKTVIARTSQAKKNKKKKVPAYFTGQIAGEKKNKKTQQKHPVKKAASQS